MTKNYRIPKFKVSAVKERSCIIPEHRIISKKDIEGISHFILEDIGIEKILIFALDGNNKIIGIKEEMGDTNQCIVYPKQVFTFLFSVSASSFIISHNHPGGNTNPSKMDWDLTKKLQRIGKDLNLTLLDHIIVTEQECISLREFSKWVN